METKKLLLSAAMIAAFGSMSAAQAADWSTVDFDKAGTSGEAFQGSFDYNGKTYGASNAQQVPDQASSTITTKLDLKQLAANKLYGKDPSDDVHMKSNDKSYDGTAPVVYRIYRQDYSAAIVNLSRGTKPRDFAKTVVGDKTKAGTLTSGNYTYKGVTFSNFPRGEFTYNVKVTGPSAATGEGSFTLNNIMVPATESSTGSVEHVSVTGAKLDKTNLVQSGGGLAFKGTVSGIKTNNDKEWKAIKGDQANPVYNMSLYGPGGKEIAGTIQGMPDRVGSVAVIGKKN